MEKDIFTNKDYELMGKLFAGEMDENHEQSFKNELMANPEKQNAFIELEKSWGNISTPDVFGKIDADKAYQKFSNRVSLKPEATKIKIIPLWLKWAASWLLIISAGVFIWFLNQRNFAQENIITLNTYNENHTFVYTLIDGSVVYLGNNTSFAFPDNYALEQRRVKISGEAFFDVVHNPQQPFIIETRQALIEVLGTSFNIKTINEDKMEVYVETGMVRVQDEKDMDITVKHGELLTLQDGSIVTITSPQFYDAAWRKHHMHFKDEKLENIIKVLNRNYTVVFDIEDDAVKNRKLTVTFYNDSYLYIAKLISETLNIGFEQKNETNIIFKDRY